MGRPKLLLPWGGTTVLGQVLQNVRHSRVGWIVVVTGCGAAEVAAEAQAIGVATVYNADWASGMTSSLRAGLRALLEAQARAQLEAVSAAFVVLADQPMVGPEVYDALIAAFAESVADPDAEADRATIGPNRADRIIVPVARGRRGNPVLFGAAFFDEILMLPAESAPRSIVERHPDAVESLAVLSEGTLFDLDDPNEYERWSRSHGVRVTGSRAV